MKEENLNKETINKKRKETEEDMKKEGAKRVRNRDEKGRFSGGSRLEATPEQIEKARKEMLEELEPVKAKLEEISNKIKELEEKYKNSSIKKGVEGSKKDIEKKINKQEKRLREVEEIKDLSKEEKENLLNEIEERFGEKPEKTKQELEKQKEDLKEDIEDWYGEQTHALGDKHKELEEKMVKAEEKIKELEEKEKNIKKEKEDNKLKTQLEVAKERANKIAKEEKKEKEKKEEKAEKTEEKEREKGNEAEEEKTEEKEREKGNEAEEEKTEEKETKEETLDLEKELPEDLVELLEQSTLDEENKSLFKKAAIKTRNLTATVGSAIGFRALAGKVPGLTNGIIGAGVGGAIGGVGYRLARYGIEAFEEKKSYDKFKENLEQEIDLEEIDSEDQLKEKLANVETNISVVSERIKELENENTELKEQGVWFFQKERREKRKEIQRHRQALEKMQDEFRYLSVEAKKELGNANVENLAVGLIEEKGKQLEAMINSGGPHGELVKDLLANTEEANDIQIDAIAEKIKQADTGLKAKLDQQGRSIPKEILTSAGIVGALGMASEYVLQIPAVQNQLDKVSDWFSQIDIDMPDFLEGNEKLTPEQSQEFKGLISGLEEESEKATLEIVDKVAELQTDYSIEMGDNVWSVTEEFLNDNLGESFASLGEAEKTYVIDYITTTIENNPESFGLDLAEGESINHLLANSEHSISFDPILSNGELATAIEKAGNLSTKEIANILENNEALRELISENPDLKLTPETIQDALENGEVSESALSELAKESSPLANIGEGVTEIPYSEGELTMHLEGNEISFSLDGTEFAEGTISEQGDYYIAIDNNKQIDLDYTKAYNSARIHLNELLDGDAEIIIEGLESEAISSGEQIANMENWLERMHEGNLNEAHFDFMAGNQKEEWIQQLADIEGVSPEEMEEMINESYQEITGEATNEAANEGVREAAQETANETAQNVEDPVVDWAEKLEEGLEEVKEGNMSPEEYREMLQNKPEGGDLFGDGYMYDAAAEHYEEELNEFVSESAEKTIESGTYRLEGSIDIMDRMDFYDNFTDSFGIEVDTNTDIVEALLTGDVTPEEFVSWLEDGAFEKEINFDGRENPTNEMMESQIWSMIDKFKEAMSEEGRRKTLKLQSLRKVARMKIDAFMLYGK